MRKFLLLCVLVPLLSACALIKQADTPEKRYYELNGAAVVVLRLADAYVKDCKVKNMNDPCYGRFPSIRTGAITLRASLDQADKVFITHDSEFYDMSLSVTENAVKNLQNAFK